MIDPIIKAFLDPIVEAGIVRYYIFLAILVGVGIGYLIIHYMRAADRRKRAVEYLVIHLEREIGEQNLLKDYSRACRRMRNNFEKAIGRRKAQNTPLSTIEEIFREAHKLMREEKEKDDTKGSKC